jgi:hypothetical protein
MKFDEWYDDTWNLGSVVKEIAETAWNAAMEEFKRNPPEGLYRIGEEVVANGKPGVVLVAVNDNTHNCNPGSIRRKPAWFPKDGEAVLFEDNNIACPGIVVDNQIMWGRSWVPLLGVLHGDRVRPFKKEFVHKPWNEV